MPPYQKNHYVPRRMLTYWASKPGKYSGTYVFDVREKRSYFASGEGSSAFAFAIVNDLYVPQLDGKRAVELEQWLSSLESPLLHIARLAHEKKPIELRTKKDQIRAEMALRALEVRSRHQITTIAAAIESDTALRRVVDEDGKASVQQLVLENLIHYVSEMAAWLHPVELVFCNSGPASFVLTDRPWFNLGSGSTLAVLTNKTVVIYQRSPTLSPRYLYDDVPRSFVDDVNQQIAFRGRDWLVADTEAQRDQYQSVYQSPKWKAVVKADSVEIVPIRILRTGWRFRRDK